MGAIVLLLADQSPEALEADCILNIGRVGTGESLECVDEQAGVADEDGVCRAQFLVGLARAWAAISSSESLWISV